MRRLISIVPLVLLAAAVACNGSPRDQTVHPTSSPAPSAPKGKSITTGENQVRCPVCDLTFDVSEAIGEHKFQGKMYYFLVADHKQAFAEDPQSYILSP